MVNLKYIRPKATRDSNCLVSLITYLPLILTLCCFCLVYQHSLLRVSLTNHLALNLAR